LIEEVDVTDSIELNNKIQNLLLNPKQNVAVNFEKQNYKPYKVGAIYNTFYGLEILKESAKSIRNIADYIVVVHQQIGSDGEKEDPKNIHILDELLNNKIIDEIVFYQPSKVYKIDQMVNKRNLGLDACKKNNCDFIIPLDTDEFYNCIDLKAEIDDMFINQINTLYSPINAYYYNKDWYFRDTYYVPSVYRVNNRCFVKTRTSVLCDPARKMREEKYKLSNVPMQHLTYMLETYNEKVKSKIMKGGNNEVAQIYEHIINWKPGDKGLVFLNDMTKGGENYLDYVDLVKRTDNF
jgi:hypothetical protein